MIRLGLSVIFGVLSASAALAGDPPNWRRPAVVAAPADARCAALGPEFFSVAGSQTCVRIIGYVSAGVGFGSAFPNRANIDRPFGAAPPATRLGAQAAVTGDARFDTPLGPARIYVGAGRN